MKCIHENFDDAEFKKMKVYKDKLQVTWRQFIILGSNALRKSIKKEGVKAK